MASHKDLPRQLRNHQEWRSNGSLHTKQGRPTNHLLTSPSQALHIHHHSSTGRHIPHSSSLLREELSHLRMDCLRHILTYLHLP
jgi:hypothetical protein